MIRVTVDEHVSQKSPDLASMVGIVDEVGANNVFIDHTHAFRSIGPETSVIFKEGLGLKG